MPIIKNCVFRFSVFLSVEVCLKCRKTKGTKNRGQKKTFFVPYFLFLDLLSFHFLCFQHFVFFFHRFDVLTIFDNLSFRHVVPSTYCSFIVLEFDVLEFSFCPLDILSDSTSRHSKFWLSAFCLLTLCS